MKNYRFITLVFFTMIAGSAMAQSTAIKINLLSPVVRTFNIAVEQKIAETGSLQLGFYYTGLKRDETSWSGFGITPEYRIYLSSTPAIAGFYVAPFLRYTSLTLTAKDTQNNTEDKATFSAYGGGVVIGKQWVFKERVTLDMFIGPKYLAHDLKVTTGTDDDFSGTNLFGGFGVRGGITLGVAF